MKIAVSCKNIRKSYATAAAPVEALRGVDLELRAGELFMLTGPSGCGKTTLLSIVAGILEASHGHCQVFGEDWTKLSAPARARYRAETIGFVFQQFQLLPTVSIQENVAVPLLIQRQKRSKAMELAAEALRLVGLGDRCGDLPAALSGGQQQRVAIARALVHSPRLIVCDEPTSALDHRTGQQILSLLRGLTQSQERTLLVVTHDSRIYSYADRIAEMDDGAIVRIRELELANRERAEERAERNSL
jgi:putative ABC transport system ATP-binding protein